VCITVEGLAAHRGPTSSLSAPSAAGLSRTAPCSAIVASGCASSLASTELNSALFALTAAAASGLFVEVVPLSSGGSRVAKQGSRPSRSPEHSAGRHSNAARLTFRLPSCV
jgi:hypothetical protein